MVPGDAGSGLDKGPARAGKISSSKPDGPRPQASGSSVRAIGIKRVMLDGNLHIILRFRAFHRDQLR